MTDVMIRALFRLSARAASDETTVVAQLDRVMAELLGIEQSGGSIRDAAVSLDLTEATVMIELLSTAADFETASGLAEGALREAIAAADGLQPTWATKVQQQAELISA